MEGEVFGVVCNPHAALVSDYLSPTTMKDGISLLQCRRRKRGGVQPTPHPYFPSLTPLSAVRGVSSPSVDDRAA